MVVYDPQTRSELQTSQPFPSKNNKRDKLAANADGSVDLYFGPTHPREKKPTGSDRPEQGLVHDPPPLRPARTVVRQGLAARGDRRDEVITCEPMPCCGGIRRRGKKFEPSTRASRSRN